MAIQTPPIDALLRYLGIDAERGHAGKWIAKCPNPAHPDTDPSWSIIDRPGDRRHGSHHCQSCKFGGGPWELAAAVWGCELAEAGKRLTAAFGLGKGPAAKHTPKVVIKEEAPPPVPFAFPPGVVIPGPGGRWYDPALAYLLNREVTRDQVDRWGMGYSLRGRLRNRVVIPVYNAAGHLLTYTARGIVRSVEPRYEAGRVSQGAKPRMAIWGEAGWQGTGIVTVAEGVFSALALERAGAPNPSALLGSDFVEDKAHLLGRFERVIVATDPDKAGDRVARALSVLGRRARLYRVNLDASPDDHDPEALRRKIDEAVSILA